MSREISAGSRPALLASYLSFRRPRHVVGLETCIVPSFGIYGIPDIDRPRHLVASPFGSFCPVRGGPGHHSWVLEVSHRCVCLSQSRHEADEDLVYPDRDTDHSEMFCFLGTVSHIRNAYLSYLTRPVFTFVLVICLMPLFNTGFDPGSWIQIRHKDVLQFMNVSVVIRDLLQRLLTTAILQYHIYLQQVVIRVRSVDT